MGLFGSRGGFFGGGCILGGGGCLFGGNDFVSTRTGGIVPDEGKIIREVIKNTDTLGGELLRTIDDSKEELHELCTDGFVEMVIKGNTDYKTSFEIKDEADQKINEVRCRYQDRCYDFNKYLDELNTQINNLYEKKIELAKRLDKNIDALPKLPQISPIFNSPSYTYKKSTISMICELTGLGSSYDHKGKKESASDYLEDAKDFEVVISGKIAEINRTQVFLDSVKMNLDEEDRMLDALAYSLDSSKVLPYNEIKEQLHILISEYILDSNGQKNRLYMDGLDRLKNLC